MGWTPSAEAGARSLPGPFIDPAPASVDVTVVEETCLEPEDLLPLDEPEEFGECWLPLDALLGTPFPGGDPTAERGLPGGRLSATDMRAAMGDCPEPEFACACCAVPADSGGELVRVLKGEPALVPLLLATETGAE